MANANRPSNYKRTARILTGACGLLFFAFSFIYLYVLQSDVLQALHLNLSGGKTTFQPFWCAFVLSVVLLLLRWVVNALLGLKGAIRTLAYFPSFLLLGVMTDVDYSVYQEGIAGHWAWVFPLVLAVYLLVVFALRRIFRWWLDIEIEGSTLVASNLLLFLAFCFMTVCIGNTHIHFHHQLAVEAALRNGNYSEVRKIGAKVVDPDRPLTALRHYALSREGQMGEYLFHTPQLYGAEGLLLPASAKETLRFTADSLYTYWGDTPRKEEKALDFFHRLCQEETGNHTTLEYYLAALLLEKQLTTFVDAWHTLYESEADFLPHYYKEALFLYQQMHPSVTPIVTDEDLLQQWEAYKARQQELRGKVEETNFMRREFGQTYWWYFEYSE